MMRRVTGHAPSDAEAAAMLAAADGDGDGRIDFDEFVRISEKVKRGEFQCGGYAFTNAAFESLFAGLDLDACDYTAGHHPGGDAGGGGPGGETAPQSAAATNIDGGGAAVLGVLAAPGYAPRLPRGGPWRPVLGELPRLVSTPPYGGYVLVGNSADPSFLTRHTSPRQASCSRSRRPSGRLRARCSRSASLARSLVRSFVRLLARFSCSPPLGTRCDQNRLASFRVAAGSDARGGRER